MARENRGLLIAFAVIGAVFALELIHLFALRLEAGDVYPPYSSYRADPLGVRALYGALDTLPEVNASRNIEPVTQLEDGQGTTLLFCGALPTDDPEDAIEALERCVRWGARLVVAFHPFAGKPELMDEALGGCAGGRCRVGRNKAEPEEEGREGEGDKEGDEDEDEEREPWEVEWVSIADRWGFDYAYAELPGRTDTGFGHVVVRKQAGPGDLPEGLPWHSALYFDNLDEAWQTLYARDDHAVLVERSWGLGAIVLASDSYLVSNEAMLKDRQPQLLAWLIGDSGHVVFDEIHLGTQERLGVMTLVRRYRLHGVVAALVVVALLFVWKNAVSLVPKREDATAAMADAGLGRDSSAALVNLLRRSIPVGAVLAVCADEWRRTFSRAGSGVEAQEAQMQAIIKAEQTSPRRDPAAAYRRICEVLRD